MARDERTVDLIYEGTQLSTFGWYALACPKCGAKVLQLCKLDKEESLCNERTDLWVKVGKPRLNELTIAMLKAAYYA